jgi:hypothetical protein
MRPSAMSLSSAPRRTQAKTGSLLVIMRYIITGAAQRRQKEIAFGTLIIILLLLIATFIFLQLV